jgi:hypothetical protein
MHLRLGFVAISADDRLAVPRKLDEDTRADHVVSEETYFQPKISP